jgi:DNA-binding transcriptional MocR family regulator
MAAMRDLQGSTQNVLRPGVVEFAFGEPDPALLPVALVRAAAVGALDRFGPGAISYGQEEGPPALREQIARRTAAREGRAVAADDVLVSGGNSQALDQALTVFSAPGDVVLVEAPTYSLALGIIRDYPVDVVGVPLDGQGLDVAALDDTMRRLRAEGRRARLLYTVPTFHNPAGVSLELGRRRRLLELARDHELIILEDDVYRELAYDGDAPPALWALDPAAPVVRLGSFSKTLAPGLRVGWIDARSDLRERLLACGMVESGGCVSQYAATVVARVLEDGGYDGHILELRAAYRARRDVLVAALREHLPAGCSFHEPAGGFFVWLALPAGLSATTLLPFAEARGVSFAPGARFRSDGDDRCLRLAFSLYEPQDLADGARRLGEAVRAALRAAP